MLPEDAILLPEIVDAIFLVASHPASQGQHEEMQSVGHGRRLHGSDTAVTHVVSGIHSPRPFFSHHTGIRLGDRSCAADSDGYQQLITWAERHGRVAAFGIEGTGSYGAGTRARGPASRAPGARSEPGRPAHPSNRREVRHRGCRDRRAVGPGWPIDRHPEDRGRGGRDDAPPQGRAPDGGQSPHLGDDHAEADRRHRAARAARDPPPARRPGAPQTLPRMALRHDQLRRPPRRNIPSGRSPVAGSLSPSRSWDHDRHLGRLTTQTSPTLREGFGIGADTAAEMLIIFGDNPDRIHSEAAFAKLCGACPIPASSGMTTGRHRLYRGGHRQAKRRAPPGRHRADAVPLTNPQLRRTTHR